MTNYNYLVICRYSYIILAIAAAIDTFILIYESNWGYAILAIILSIVGLGIGVVIKDMGLK